MKPPVQSITNVRKRWYIAYVDRCECVMLNGSRGGVTSYDDVISVLVYDYVSLILG